MADLHVVCFAAHLWMMNRRKGGNGIFGRAKMKAEIVRLAYRVAELEERLCPCEDHDWKEIGSRVYFGAYDIETVYTRKCRRCGKVMEK